MAGRWGDPSAFRADPTATPSARPSRRQTLALLVVLIAAAGAVAVTSYAVRPERARAFELLHGSVFLADEQSPVAVDLGSGKPTLQLVGAAKQVGVTSSERLGVVPLDGGTLLLNRTTGEFNMVDSSGFVVKHDGGGVPLGRATGDTTAMGIASGALAYIVRNSADRSEVYLVSQATVTSAINATAAVRPRASTVLTDGSVETSPGGAVSADGALWALVRLPDGRHAVRQLAYPPRSNAGVRLTSTGHGAVSGPAALAMASSDGGTSVGLATGTRLTVFHGKSTDTVPFTPGSAVDAVLPATNRGTRLAFLLHGAGGWLRISVGADGQDVQGPTPVKGIAAGAKLAQPAYSGDALYTMDLDSGRIYRIDRESRAAAIPGMERYPLARVNGATVELPAMPDGYAIARESRVIFNSGSHANAVIVFTDGSRPPQVIEKISAVRVSASGGAEELTRSTVNPGQASNTNPPPKGQKPRTTPQQVVNPRLDCKDVSQKPHIPVIGPPQAGSRSVTLSWTYPIVDKTQDCYPTTYVVSVKLLSTNAPQPPGSVKVESQVGATITGLFPLSRYEFTVTAYIHGQGTASTPFQVRTGPEGPAAPTDLTVAADATGNWVLNWNSCGTVQQGCVAAETWTVTPSFCDGRGLSAPPTPATSTADPTSRQQPAFRYRGSDALLGRGLQFVVTGSGQSQVPGTPSARSKCVYSWSPPDASAMTVSASSPPDTASSTDTTDTTVTVRFAHGQVRDLGGVGGTLTYELLNDGKVVTTKGPTTEPSTTLSGIRAGQRYQVRVLASPPRHREVVATVGPVDVVPAVANWPDLTLPSATFESTNATSGTLHVRFALEGADTRGETFVLTDKSQLVCGNAGIDLSRSDVSPGDDLTFDVDRFAVYGDSCTVTLQVSQDPRTATDPPLYGAGASRAVTSAPLSIPPPFSTSGSGDFSAQWGGTTGNPTVLVSYHGRDDLDFSSGWNLTVSNGSNADCGSANDRPPTTISVDKACVRAGGTFVVTISYRYFGVLVKDIDPVRVQGDAPQPVDPAKISFTAAWNDNPDLPQVDVTYTGSEPTDDVAPLQFTEVVTSGGVTCGSNDANPATSSARVDVDLAQCPATAADGTAATYTIEIKFTDPNYGQSGDYTYQVSGTPPTQ